MPNPMPEEATYTEYYEPAHPKKLHSKKHHGHNKWHHGENPLDFIEFGKMTREEAKATAGTFINSIILIGLTVGTFIYLSICALCLCAITKVKDNQKVAEKYIQRSNPYLPTVTSIHPAVSQQQIYPQVNPIVRGTAIN